MTTLLFPRLRDREAVELLRDRLRELNEGERLVPCPSHDRAQYAQTGGTRVTTERLRELRDSIVSIAGRYGFPSSPFPMRSRALFEAECAEVLWRDSFIPIGEALHAEMWSYLTVLLLPDVAAWRFPPEASDGDGGVPKKVRDRFLGGTRNVFGRLWRRAFLLGQEGSVKYLKELPEDALVQITERPGISSNREVAQAIAHEWVLTASRRGRESMEDLMRAAMRRVSFRAGPIHVAALSSEDLRLLIQSCFAAASGDVDGTAESELVLPSPDLAADPPTQTPSHEPLELKPYDAFSGETVPVSQASVVELERGLLDIVAVEGPVLGERLLQAYVTASGGRLVGREISRSLNRAVSRLVRSHRLEEEDPLQEGGVKPKTFRLPEHPLVSLRELGPRSIYQVPPRELKGTIDLVDARERTETEEASQRGVLKLVGLKRLTNGIRERLHKVSQAFN